MQYTCRSSFQVEKSTFVLLQNTGEINLLYFVIIIVLKIETF